MAVKKFILASITAILPLAYGCQGELFATCSATCSSDFNGEGLTGPAFGGLHLGMRDCPYLNIYGFQISNGHAGGIGDTLEWTGCDNGIHLMWAYGSLAQINLSQGWTGKTERSVGIGDSLENVLANYPSIKQLNSDSLQLLYEDKEYSILFSFDQNNDVENMALRSSFPSLE